MATSASIVPVCDNGSWIPSQPSVIRSAAHPSRNAMVRCASAVYQAHDDSIGARVRVGEQPEQQHSVDAPEGAERIFGRAHQ